MLVTRFTKSPRFFHLKCPFSSLNSQTNHTLGCRKWLRHVAFSVVVFTDRLKQTKNSDRRKREYLTPAEVKDLREAAKAYERHGARCQRRLISA